MRLDRRALIQGRISGRSLSHEGIKPESNVDESGWRESMKPPATDEIDVRPEGPFDRVSQRQRIYLRHVARNLSSKEIAEIEGVSARAVDKQLYLAKTSIGAATRSEAARRLVAHEEGVESFYPANALPVQEQFRPLSLPVPNRRMSVNLIKVREVLIWSAIIGIAITVGLAVAAMLINALMILFGAKPV